MATNLIQDDGLILANIAATAPTTPVSGSPVRYGSLTGVALTNEGEGGNSSGNITMDMGQRVWDLLVHDSGGAGISVGDALYFDDTATGSGTTTNINKDGTNGYFFGFALEAISAGSQDTIKVLHVPSPGAGTLGSGTISASHLAAGAVEAAELAGNLKVGFIPLDITGLREIASNAIQNLAAHGGLLASDSAPLLQRVNGATDKALRVVWTAEADTDEAQFPPVALPPDFNAGADCTIHLLAAMESTNDTPTIDVQVYNGVGDTEMGGATAAITGTSVAEYTVTIANANVANPPGVLNISLVPAAHETDDLYVYAAWIEYTRTN